MTWLAGRDPKQGLDESALTAPQVEHPRRADAEHGRGHSFHSLLVQADAFLDLVLLAVVLLVDLRLVISSAVSQSSQDVGRERTPVLQKSTADHLPGGMGRQPRAAPVEQLASLVLPDPVCLSSSNTCPL